MSQFIDFDRRFTSWTHWALSLFFAEIETFIIFVAFDK
jgi:hypothetical protein